MKLPRYLLVGLLVLALLLIAPSFRWKELATTTHEGYKVVYYRDRWSKTSVVREYSPYGKIRTKETYPGWVPVDDATDAYLILLLLAMTYTAVAGVIWAVHRRRARKAALSQHQPAQASLEDERRK